MIKLKNENFIIIEHSQLQEEDSEKNNILYFDKDFELVDYQKYNDGREVATFKGPKLDEELSEASNAFKTFEVRGSDIEIYRLLPPEIPFERNFVAIHKTRTIPTKYPRKAGTPLSKPL